MKQKVLPGNVLLKLFYLWLLCGLSAPSFSDQQTPAADVNAADHALRALIVPADFGSIELAPHLDLLEDKQRILSFEDIVEGREEQFFVSEEEKGANFGFSKSAYWVRFTLRNGSDEQRNVILRQDYPLIDYLDLWYQSPTGEWQTIETGDRRPFAQRPLSHRDFLFPLKLEPNAQQTFYLRYFSEGSVNIGLSLYHPNYMLIDTSGTQLLLGFFYGGFIALAIYNLLMFMVMKDKAFFSYFIYLLSIGIYMSIHNGLAYQYLWPSNPALANYGLVLFLGLTLFFALNFTRQLLDTEKIAPRSNRVIIAVQAAVVICIALISIMPYHQLIVIISLLTAASITMVMYQGIVAFRKGHPASRYFLLAWSFLCFGVLLYELKSFGLVPHNAITQNGQQWGNWLEMIFLSMALSSRVNEIKRSTTTDPLTGTFNRRDFDDKLRGLFGKSRATGKPLSIMVVDVDFFKAFNDQHGHAEGDKVLRHVASVMAEALPKNAMLFRIGGEEFAILLQRCSLTAAAGIAEVIRSRVATSSMDGQSVTVSIGVACAQPGRYGFSDQLFRAADKAMYQSKNAGRNRVSLAEDVEKQSSAKLSDLREVVRHRHVN